jgi:UPF0755 protein
MVGCALVSGALSFVLLVLLAMIPAVRGFVRSSVVKLVGGSVQRVTIPEGWNRFQVASRLENQRVVSSAEAFLKATEDPALLDSLGIPSDTAEGYLFPDTYDFYRVSEPEDVVEKLVSNYVLKIRNVSRRHSTGLRDLGPLGDDPEHVAVILASIVEKEAVKTEEMPLIAGVFLNRLLDEKFKSHLLQADPTVSYGCLAGVPLPASCSGFTGRLGRSHLDDATNPYNTYQHPGLPPGPISNPGISALEAVLAPADTKYMYFVARGNGTHSFSTTLEQHKAAVKKYRDGH